jgi:hypothetical protein
MNESINLDSSPDSDCPNKRFHLGWVANRTPIAQLPITGKAAGESRGDRIEDADALSHALTGWHQSDGVGSSGGLCGCRDEGGEGIEMLVWMPRLPLGSAAIRGGGGGGGG